MNTPKVNASLQASYDIQYTQDLSEWRGLGAKPKAHRISSLWGAENKSRVLDCGAGEGSILSILHDKYIATDFYALEISDSALKTLKERKLERLRNIEKFDGYTIPYSSQFFDLVFCSHVIEHVEHPRLLIRELKRVSRQQIFEIPIDYYFDVDSKVLHFHNYGHINIYTPSLFRFLLKSEGLHVDSEIYASITKDELQFIRKVSNYQLSWFEKYTKMGYLKKQLIKTLIGQRRYLEYYTQFYACLTYETGEMTCFKGI